MKGYDIPFVGLKQGKHEFDYQIKDNFFSDKEYSLVKKGNVEVELDLTKQDVLLILEFRISGEVWVECDRCLEEFPLEIEAENRIIIKFGDEAFEESDEIVVIPRESSEINVEQFIYEFINLALPIKKVHPDDEDGNSLCNPDVLKKLNGNAPETNDSIIDPRWEGLKNFFKKN